MSINVFAALLYEGEASARIGFELEVSYRVVQLAKCKTTLALIRSGLWGGEDL